MINVDPILEKANGRAASSPLCFISGWGQDC